MCVCTKPKIKTLESWKLWHFFSISDTHNFWPPPPHKETSVHTKNTEEEEENTLTTCSQQRPCHALMNITKIYISIQPCIIKITHTYVYSSSFSFFCFLESYSCIAAVKAVLHVFTVRVGWVMVHYNWLWSRGIVATGMLDSSGGVFTDERYQSLKKSQDGHARWYR